MVTRKRVSRGQVTVARALSKLGAASRSRARELVAAGEVTVNGDPVTDPGAWMDPREDRLAILGRPVKPAGSVYLMMHKPRGVITTRSDEGGRATVYDLLPAEPQRVFPVGRLDKDTSGLLLFTNDTRFGESVTNPLSGTGKTYRVFLDRPLRDEDAVEIASGMILKDETRLRPAEIVRDRAPASYLMTITEGRNRQIRRMCGDLGYAVGALVRIGIGGVELGALPEGGVRALTDDEVLLLTQRKAQGASSREKSFRKKKIVSSGERGRSGMVTARPSRAPAPRPDRKKGSGEEER